VGSQPYSAHDQSGGDVLGFAAHGERGEVDLGVGYPALHLVIPDSIRVADWRHAWSAMVLIALVTDALWRVVTENRAPARRAAAMMS
jgi:hypothetical protein